MKKLIVDKKNNNKKIIKYILDEFPSVSTNLLYKTLRKKDIKVNGKRISDNITVYENDEIVIFITDEFLENKVNLNIFYEDENIIVINKPYNIEVTGENSLTTQLHKKFTDMEFKPMPCHRLDRNTIGLILYAKNLETLEILMNKFKNHEIEKHYLALVYGIPKEYYKKCQDYLFKDKKKSMVYISNTMKKGYQNIVTSYKVLEKRENNTSVLDVEIETGKTHQIRAHLAYLGYPIIGDGKYGINEVNKEFNKKYQMLCSYIIKFNFTSDSGVLNYLNGKKFILNFSF